MTPEEQANETARVIVGDWLARLVYGSTYGDKNLPWYTQVNGDELVKAIEAPMAVRLRQVRELTLLVHQIIANRACICNRAEHRCGTNQMLDDLAAILSETKPEDDRKWSEAEFKKLLYQMGKW